MTTAFERLRAQVLTPQGLGPLRILCASGALGFGIPRASLEAGFARRPHLVGCDMGSVDPGPHYLGSGEMGAAEVMARGDLEAVLTGACAVGIPVLVGTAGTAGAAVQVDKVAAIVREIARRKGLRFKMARIYADIDAGTVAEAVDAGNVRPLRSMPALTKEDALACRAIVGQMGVEPFQRALEAGADVVIAGRSCDTAIFAAVPLMLGFPIGPSIHLSKIVECASLCCIPGGPDPIMGILEGDTFVLESMDASRVVTPMSAAAHSLYEEADPYRIVEPDGVITLADVKFEAVDERRVRGSGARWTPSAACTVKIEGASYEGERAILLAATADPRVIANIDAILTAVEKKARDVLPARALQNLSLSFRRYGLDGVVAWPARPSAPPREVFLLGECIAPEADTAVAALAVVKQNLLHFGFEGRLSTGGNIAFPFTPPEVRAGPAWCFRVYHVMDAPDMPSFFPMSLEDL